MSMIQKYELQGKPGEGFIAVRAGRRWEEDRRVRALMQDLDESYKTFATNNEDTFDVIDQLVTWAYVQENRMNLSLTMAKACDGPTADIRRNGLQDIQVAYQIVERLCEDLFSTITDCRRELAVQYPVAWKMVFGEFDGNYTIISTDKFSKAWMRALNYHSRAKWRIAQTEAELDKLEDEKTPTPEPKATKRPRFGNNK